MRAWPPREASIRIGPSGWPRASRGIVWPGIAIFMRRRAVGCRKPGAEIGAPGGEHGGTRLDRVEHRGIDQFRADREI
ncbi:hypothetical protein, partial [Acidiphilium iwatense]|uniref:hypothetical protein n=1 Tax=Acidiphilium iwatense TaxID=768198 RepID=UPI001F3CC1F2